MEICTECIKLGRMSKTNLLIDFREIKHVLETSENIMAVDYVALCEQKNMIMKKLLDRTKLPRALDGRVRLIEDRNGTINTNGEK